MSLTTACVVLAKRVSLFRSSACLCSSTVRTVVDRNPVAEDLLESERYSTRAGNSCAILADINPFRASSVHAPPVVIVDAVRGMLISQNLIHFDSLMRLLPKLKANEYCYFLLVEEFSLYTQSLLQLVRNLESGMQKHIFLTGILMLITSLGKYDIPEDFFLGVYDMVSRTVAEQWPLPWWKLIMLRDLLLAGRTYHKQLLDIFNHAFWKFMCRDRMRCSADMAACWVYPLAWMSYPIHKELDFIRGCSLPFESPSDTIELYWCYIAAGMRPPELLNGRVDTISAIPNGSLTEIALALRRYTSTSKPRWVPQCNPDESIVLLLKHLSLHIPTGHSFVPMPHGESLHFCTVYHKKKRDFINFHVYDKRGRYYSPTLPGTQNIALKLVPRSHMLRGDSEVSGVFSYQVRQLRMQGWRCILVPMSRLEGLSPAEAGSYLNLVLRCECNVL